MRQKFAFSNLLMTILVVCTMMYQSVHSFTHILEEITVENAHHDGSHHHVDSKHCYVCDFTFSPFTTVDFQSFTFLTPQKPFQKYAFSEQSFCYLSIQNTFLRGPPAFI